MFDSRSQTRRAGQVYRANVGSAATGAILQGQLKGNPIYNLGDYSRSNLNNPDDEKLHFRHKTLLKQQLHLSAL
jgi:hypothetical protein